MSVGLVAGPRGAICFGDRYASKRGSTRGTAGRSFRAYVGIGPGLHGVGFPDAFRTSSLNASRRSAFHLTLVAPFTLVIVMTTPMEPLVAQLVAQLDASDREDFEERAAIMEFEAMHSRKHAECLALLDVLNRHPAALTGISVMQVELGGVSSWLMTTDIQLARQRVAYLGGSEIGLIDPITVVEGQYGGIALLTTVL